MSEFQPPRGRWIPYRIDRSVSENLFALRSALGKRTVEFVAVSLQPGSPYGPMRRLALRVAPLRALLYNENLDHFTLRPNSWPAALRYLRWKTREHIVWQTHPGGDLYTLFWRLRHPREFRRPLLYLAAKRAGRTIARRKRSIGNAPIAQVPEGLPAGVSVVIPSRNGRDLLLRLLPRIEGADEVIVIDNGSEDGTVQALSESFPNVRVEAHAQALSFARAVNRGIALAQYSHVLLLNNDMLPHAGFLPALRAPFDAVPDLFCATAQIFFPDGRRREETGKAVMPSTAGAHDFPVQCGTPLDGEDGSYVLYGSGGCSLYRTSKLRALGGFNEVFEPAYVEDLDVGFRAWQRAWPTIFVAGAQVTHEHRATTSRYFTAEALERITERNYLRFLASAVGDAAIFERLWRHAVERLNWKAAIEHHQPSLEALAEAPQMAKFVKAVPAAAEERILALSSGDVAVFPGRAVKNSATVLIATAYMPFPLSHGGAVRMYNLMRRAHPEFTQVLVAFVDELHTPAPELLEVCAEIVQVRRLGSHVKRDQGRPDVVEEFDTPAFRAALEQTVRKWKPAIAQFEFTQMALYATDCVAAKTVMVEHDVTIDLYQQLLETSEDWELRQQLDRWRTFETEAWRITDCVVVMSNKDAAGISGARKVVTLPNGVDLERFQPSTDHHEPNRLLFIGSFAHLPNLLALDFFMADVWPHLAHRRPLLHVIAGKQHRLHFDRWRDRLRLSLETPGLLIEDFVADVRPAYRQASVVVAPLLASAGTNIKIMEAMAMGKAIVSTAGGVNGLDLASGQDIIVENDPAKMAKAIERLLASPEERAAIGRRARATVEARFNWDTIAAAQAEMYRELLRS